MRRRFVMEKAQQGASGSEWASPGLQTTPVYFVQECGELWKPHIMCSGVGVSGRY